MILAFALGPLNSTDLLALMKRIHDTKGLIAPDRLLKPLSRFVFGSGKEGTGYVLSHPKIGEYLQRNRFAELAHDLRHGFAAWGRALLEELNAGGLKPEEASSYLLQFFPEHLKQANASPDDFMMMVEDGWRRAWEHLEGGQRGFASAVQKAWAAQLEDGTDLVDSERNGVARSRSHLLGALGRTCRGKLHWRRQRKAFSPSGRPLISPS